MRTPDEFIRISRYLDGECSPEEEIIVRAWLEQDPDAFRWAEDVRAAEFMVGETLGVLWSMPPIEAVLNAADAAAVEEARATSTAVRQANAARAGSSDRGASARHRVPGSESSARLAKVNGKTASKTTGKVAAATAGSGSAAASAGVSSDAAGADGSALGRVVALASRYRQAAAGMAAGIAIMALVGQPGPAPDDSGVVWVGSAANTSNAASRANNNATDAGFNGAGVAETNNAAVDNAGANPLNHVDIGDPEDMQNTSGVDRNPGANDNNGTGGNNDGSNAAVDNNPGTNDGNRADPTDGNSTGNGAHIDNPDSRNTTPDRGPADWAPVAVSIEPQDAGIHLSWAAPMNVGEMPAGYVVYRLSSLGHDGQFVEVGRVDPNETAFVDGDVVDGAMYQYRIASLYVADGVLRESETTNTGDLEYGPPVQIRFVGLLQGRDQLVTFRVLVWDGDWVSRSFRAKPGEAFDCAIGECSLHVDLVEVFELDPEDARMRTGPSMYVRCDVTRDGATETVEIPFHRG